MEAILRRMEWADSTVLGPGISQNAETTSLMESLFLRSRGKVLVDADALTGLAKGGSSIFQKRKAPSVITPHAGEFARITGLSVGEIEMRRLQHARTAAKKYGVLVVLKGAPTVTAVPDGTVYVNSSGNPGMATVGMGDVLSGMIASLWAQGADVACACYGGVYLHGLSGDLAARELGERSLVAGDLMEYLPDAIMSAEGV
jgi:NAD(P)H-hydrate epimerase